ncbi:MAG TPA: CheR family methyltransferase, partial [Roseiflexaceae bacterium]
MAVTHNQTLQDYEAYLEAHPEEIGDLVMAFLIKVTEFFRDAGAFTYLRDQILPSLIERGRENGHVLRFWSAGCATGEEPYSLALLLAELLGKELPEWSIKIFATDIDEGAISFARRGLYPRNILGNMPDEYRQRFFEPVDQGYRIVKSLRQMVIFGQQDLSRGAPFPRIDLVVCRNLLIYFKPELQQHVLDLFAYSLHQVNGYLFLGKAETARPSKAIFDLIDKRFKLYRCVNGSIPIPSRHAMNPTEGSLPERHRGRRPSQNDKPLADHDLAMAALEIAPLRWFNEQVLRFVPIGVVVIDRAYRIVTINSVARRYLGIRDAGHEQDFLHSVRGLPYAQVRNTIDSVFRERSTVTLPEIELDPAAGGNGRLLMFTIALLQPEAGMPEMALVSVSDGTEQLQTRRRLEAVQAEQKQLVDELSAANRRLTDMNQELQDANEELQAANEEMMLAQEELQATNEEFEATNEELQATNEELETNNEELQATNEELETTNDELTARSTELQGLAHMLEGERVRLAEMVELAPFHIIVLRGRNLIVEAFNPHYSRLLDGREAQGRPLDEVIEYFWGGGSEIVDLIRAAYQEDLPRVTPRMAAALPDEPEEPVERYFVYTIVPTHDAAGQVDGVVVYAEDMTEQRARDAEGQREQLRLIFDHTRQIALALYDAETLGLLMASPRYLEGAARAHSANPHDLIGRKLPDLDWFVSGDVAAELWDEVLRSRAMLRRPEVHIQLDPHQPETVWDWFLTPIMDTEQPDRVRYMLVSAVE